MFLKRKVGVTERRRSLNPSKAIVMVICPIIVHFSTKRARSMYDVACEVCVRSKDAQKQLARTSLMHLTETFAIKLLQIVVSDVSPKNVLARILLNELTKLIKFSRVNVINYCASIQVATYHCIKSLKKGSVKGPLLLSS